MAFPGYLGGRPFNASDMLQPLLCFSNLRALKITFQSQFTLLDDDLRTMASAWPQLEELELVDFPKHEYSPPPPPMSSLFYSLYPFGSHIVETTFHGLISLLRLCPHLCFFHVAIDTTKLDGLRGDKPGGGVCNRRVRDVKLIHSPINDPEAVARILLDILPEFESVFGSHTSYTPPFIPEKWIRVQEIIRAAKKPQSQGL